MKFIPVVSIVILQFTVFAQDSIREYFLDVDFEHGKKQLVIMTENPQTPFAREFGNRIYKDSALLEHIQNDMHKTLPVNRTEIHYFCGYDIFIYLKTGKNLMPITSINSDCPNDPWKMSFIKELSQKGELLSEDTLRNYCNSSLLKKNNRDEIIFMKESLYGEFQENWDTEYTGNAVNFAPWYYDGHFEIDIPVNNTQTVDFQIRNYFIESGLKNISELSVNWYLDHESIYKLNWDGFPVNTSNIHLRVFLDEDYFRFFPNQTIISHDDSTKQSQLKSDDFYLIYRN